MGPILPYRSRHDDVPEWNHRLREWYRRLREGTVLAITIVVGTVLVLSCAISLIRWYSAQPAVMSDEQAETAFTSVFGDLATNMQQKRAAYFHADNGPEYVWLYAFKLDPADVETFRNRVVQEWTSRPGLRVLPGDGSSPIWGNSERLPWWRPSELADGWYVLLVDSPNEFSKSMYTLAISLQTGKGYMEEGRPKYGFRPIIAKRRNTAVSGPSSD